MEAAHGKSATDAIRALYQAGSYDAAWRLLLDRAQVEDEYGSIAALCRWRKKLAVEREAPGIGGSIKVALLSGATTDLLQEPLILALESRGLACEIFMSGYNTIAREMLDPNSATAAFDPDVAVLVTTPWNIPGWPESGATPGQVEDLVEETVAYWIGLCAKLHEHATCDIVFSTFHPLPTRLLGNLGPRVVWEPNSFLRAVNAELARRLPPYVHLNDVEALASMYGVLNWLDLRYWYHAKQPVSFACLAHYVRNVAQVIGALSSRTAKCIVLDLDNTLWGGVVGDDGPENLVLGEGDGLGEAFKAFQQYLRHMKDRGVLLAVCSKNEEENALAPFEALPEMVLQREDFVAFKANWMPKSENIKAIAQELNLGVDALMFVDDNPAERQEVRLALPDVKVVELSDDPALFPLDLDRTGWLETVGLSAEDGSRSRLYRENEHRDRERESLGDYAGYLRSLEQVAVIAPFEDRFMERITQLTNKTNQFNLTTARMNRSELTALKNDRNVLTAYVRLADRFGDNGLISVFAAHPDGRDLRISLWLMSCRVFGREVERQLCNHVVAFARGMGVEALRGDFIPTPKNGLVRDHYSSLGFSKLEQPGAGEGTTSWRLPLNAFEPFETAITLADQY